MGCGNSVENVKDTRRPEGKGPSEPTELTEKVINREANPVKEVKNENENENENDMNETERRLSAEKEKEQEREREREREREKEREKERKEEERIAASLNKSEKKKEKAGETITNNLSLAFQNKKSTKEKEKEKEERQLMEMFQSLTPKMRFQAAKKLQRDDVQKSSAIEMIQIEWRAKLARKRANERRIERERKRREKASIALQCAIRVFIAKTKLFALKAERERLRREGAAVYIQCAWRVKVAQEKLFQLRVAHGAAIFLQCRWRIFLSIKELQKRKRQHVACIQIQRRLRGILGRKHFLQLMKALHPHTFMILLKTISLTTGGTGSKISTNVSVIATSYTLQSRSEIENKSITQQKTGSKNTKRSCTVSGPEGPNEYTLRSWTQSKQINDTSTPVWNEELTVTNSTWNSQIVLTLVEHGRFGKHSVIGQTIIEVSEYPSLYEKSSKADLISIPMDLYTIPIKDSSGKDLVPIGTPPSPIHAFLWCSIRLPPLTRSMCGWVWRLPGRIIGGANQFKRRWMVLIDRMLVYYEDPYTLHTFKGALVLEDVVSIVNEKRKDGPAIRLNCRQGSGPYVEHWTIRWDQSEPLYIQQMWERKLRRCLPLHATYTQQDVE